jgi:two-component system, chemotaxis family, sensor kinase CheA
MLLKHKRIFVVENNAGNLAILALYLERAGATVKFDRFGVNLAWVLQSHLPIDLILTDLALPNQVSGYVLLQQIRQVPQLANIPVIAVSASDPDQAIPRARALGFNGFIAKPINGAIARYVNDVLNGKQVWIVNSPMFV